MTRRPHNPTRARPGSVIVVVMWTIAVAALIASSIQLFAFRQSTLGYDAVHRVQARWAARAGVENTISMMAVHLETPIPDDPLAFILDLDYVSSYDELFQAGYDIQYHREGFDIAGPLDEHSRFNINGDPAMSFQILEDYDMTPDVAAAVTDWIDDDDDPGMIGAEEDYYRNRATPYKPRNGPLHSLAEMELIAGIWGDFMRGEDWNFNNRKDPNEDDGMRSAPDDEPDGYLEQGWAGKLTVHSVDGGATDSGLPRLYLRRTEPEELMNRCYLEMEQAEVLVAFGRQDDNELVQLITTPLTFIDDAGRISEEEINPTVPPLTRDQLRSVLAETQTYPLYERRPGRVNLNTVAAELLRDLLEAMGVDPVVADEIVYLRDAEGIASILDLDLIPGIDDGLIQQLAGMFTTSGNVFTISSRGRSSVSGMEVEMIVVVDRSSLPVRILEYREQ